MLNVALVVGFNSDLEAQSIRASLEYFGARVVTYWIGRPKDFVKFFLERTYLTILIILFLLSW